MLVAAFFLKLGKWPAVLELQQVKTCCYTKSCPPVYSKFSEARLSMQNAQLDNQFLLLLSWLTTLMWSPSYRCYRALVACLFKVYWYWWYRMTPNLTSHSHHHLDIQESHTTTTGDMWSFGQVNWLCLDLSVSSGLMGWGQWPRRRSNSLRPSGVVWWRCWRTRSHILGKNHETRQEAETKTSILDLYSRFHTNIKFKIFIFHINILSIITCRVYLFGIMLITETKMEPFTSQSSKP